MRSAFFAIALALAATGRPMRRQNAVDLQNGQEAIALKYVSVVFTIQIN